MSWIKIKLGNWKLLAGNLVLQVLRNLVKPKTSGTIFLNVKNFIIDK